MTFAPSGYQPSGTECAQVSDPISLPLRLRSLFLNDDSDIVFNSEFDDKSESLSVFATGVLHYICKA